MSSIDQNAQQQHTWDIEMKNIPVDSMQQTLLSYSDLQNAGRYDTFRTTVPLLQCST